jgi:hypothetical protein
MTKQITTRVLLAMAAGILVLAALPCPAVERDEESIWAQDKPRKPPLRRSALELTDERIERIMNRLSEAEPEKAEELTKLREQDPEKFEAELRQIIRRRAAKPRRAHDGRGPGFGERGFRGGAEHRREGRGMGRGRGPDEEGRFGPMMRRHRERFSEFLEWMQENYPDRAEKFGKWQDQSLHPGQGPHLPPGGGTYMKIFEASKDNPKLAEVRQ